MDFDNSVQQWTAYACIAVLALVLVISRNQKAMRRWWVGRRAALKDARLFLKRYGQDARQRIMTLAESEPDPRMAKHLRRVLRFVPDRR